MFSTTIPLGEVAGFRIGTHWSVLLMLVGVTHRTAQLTE